MTEASDKLVADARAKLIVPSYRHLADGDQIVALAREDLARRDRVMARLNGYRPRVKGYATEAADAAEGLAQFDREPRVMNLRINGHLAKAEELERQAQVERKHAELLRAVLADRQAAVPATDALSVAKAFLAETLACGPMPAAVVKEAAGKRDIAWRTLVRARADLGVESSQAGRRWNWNLRMPSQDANSRENPLR
jgi:hypothetical protein